MKGKRTGTGGSMKRVGKGATRKKIQEKKENSDTEDDTSTMTSEEDGNKELSDDRSEEESFDESGDEEVEGSEMEESASDERSEEAMKDGLLKTIFMKGLNYDLKEEELKDEMEKIGRVVRVGIPQTNDRKRNKGFGYVEFMNNEDVKKALELNGTVFLGRVVAVDMARARSEKKIYTMYVSGIPFECDKRRLRNYFESTGHVIGTSFPYDRENDRLRGYGFVDYDNKEDYEAALKKKLVFDESIMSQKPANRSRTNDFQVKDAGRKYDRRVKNKNEFRDRRGFKDSRTSDFSEKKNGKKNTGKNERNGKRVKFDSDSQ